MVALSMSREPITFDPSAWTGMGITAPKWPSPKDYPYPLPLEARESGRIHLVVGCGLLLLAVFFGLTGLKHARQPFGAAVIITFLGAVGVLELLYARKLYRTQTSHQPAIAMSADGLILPEFEKPIPWSEVVNADQGLNVTIRDEERFNPIARRRVATMRCAKPVRVALQELLDVSPKVLFEALQAHRAHFGNGGRHPSC
jgi:hypothetical protein